LEGARAMTLQYAAPEQLKGEAITTATDVYALGVLLYVLLTGEHPAGSGPRTPADLISSIVDNEPTRPSDTVSRAHQQNGSTGNHAALRGSSPERLRRLLAGDLDTIVVKALKKERAERYPSVTALADDLHHYLKNEPIGARPDTLYYRAAKFVRRNRTAVALGAVAVVGIGGGGVGSWVQKPGGGGQRELALREG